SADNGGPADPCLVCKARSVSAAPPPRSFCGDGNQESDEMSAAENIFIRGIGAVSPAGWGVLPLREALAKGEPWPTRELDRPGWARPFRVRRVPPPLPRPGFMSHSRF